MTRQDSGNGMNWIALQVIVKAIQMEDRLPVGGIGEWGVWTHTKETSIDIGQFN